VQITITLFINICTASYSEDHPTITWSGSFPRSISAFNIFADPVTQTSNPGLIPFDILTPLFSDYAQKDRFIYLPDGAKLTYQEHGAFDLPVGSALVKSFSYPADFREPTKNRRLLETRLLIHTPDEGWVGAAYVWNADYSDATLKVAGATIPIDWIDASGTQRHTDYLVPNMNQCKHCHRAEGVVRPLGLTARQLNRGTPNQLAHWTELGILNGAPAPELAPRIATWNDPATGTIEERALSYLDANCAHCHNPKGLAGTTLLYFTLDEALVHRPGVYHRPTAAGNASRGRNFAIVPGNPDASFLLTRLSSTHPFIRMPQVGRTVVHDEGVALVKEWILSLSDNAIPATRNSDN